MTQKGPEGELLAQIIGPADMPLAKLFRWRTAHFRPLETKHGWRTPVSGDGKGFPDLVLVRRPRVVFAETKSDTGSLSEDQGEWARELAQCSRVEFHVWRPRDLDEIVRILK